MKRLPPEHIIPEPRRARDLAPGEGAWVDGIKADHDGVVYVAKSATVHDSEYKTMPLGNRYKLARVERTETGWRAEIPREMLPLKPLPQELLMSGGYVVDDFEIVD